MTWSADEAAGTARKEPTQNEYRKVLESLMSNLIRILLAIFLPPVGVLLTVGLGWPFWINILLTLFGYIPGIVHAVWIIARRTR